MSCVQVRVGLVKRRKDVKSSIPTEVHAGCAAIQRKLHEKPSWDARATTVSNYAQTQFAHDSNSRVVALGTPLSNAGVAQKSKSVLSSPYCHDVAWWSCGGRKPSGCNATMLLWCSHVRRICQTLCSASSMPMLDALRLCPEHSMGAWPKLPRPARTLAASWHARLRLEHHVIFQEAMVQVILLSSMLGMQGHLVQTQRKSAQRLMQTCSAPSASLVRWGLPSRTR